MTFLDEMPDSVAAQRDLLRALVAELAADEAWRWCELGCSLARGAGDEWSDIDCGAGLSDDLWPDGLGRVEPMTRGLGDVIDVLHHWLGEQSRHTIVQYASGVQLSFVVMPATARKGLPPQAIALLDKDDTLATSWTPSVYGATADDRREWSFLGWIALSDCAKYLARGSLWEARQRVEDARGYVFRLWALRSSVSYPLYGLTSVLDAEVPLPGGIAATVAGLDTGELWRAARRCAELLQELGEKLAIGAHVRGLL